MKYLCLLLLLLAFSCHSPQKNDDIINKSSVPLLVKVINESLLKINSVDKLVATNHNQLQGRAGDFTSFKKYLTALNDTTPTSIAFALDYIKTCLPPDLPERDSVVLLFNLKFFKVTNKLSDDLETQYAALTKQLEKGIQSPELSAFRENLKACGIGIFSTEGNYYLDVLPNYFYGNFKDRVSEGAKTYLDLRRHELIEGFSEDAGMLISYNKL